MPGRATVKVHQLNHIPFAPWCCACLAERGCGSPHITNIECRVPYALRGVWTFLQEFGCALMIIKSDVEALILALALAIQKEWAGDSENYHQSYNRNRCVVRASASMRPLFNVEKCSTSWQVHGPWLELTEARYANLEGFRFRDIPLSLDRRVEQNWKKDMLLGEVDLCMDVSKASTAEELAVTVDCHLEAVLTQNSGFPDARYIINKSGKRVQCEDVGQVQRETVLAKESSAREGKPSSVWNLGMWLGRSTKEKRTSCRP